MQKRTRIMAGLIAAAAGGLAIANSDVDSTYQSSAMVGIRTSDGKLHRYDFSTNTHTIVGVVKDKTGKTFTGINASSYITGNMNIFAYWTDPDDGLCKLVYVNAITGEAVIVGTDLGTGVAGGAVAAQIDGYGLDNKRWVNFVILQAKKVNSSNLKIVGSININPNNSPQNEFHVTKDNNEVFTRDHLKTGQVNEAGTYYAGTAKRVLVKPKGNGNQNGLLINGQIYPVTNNTTYVFTGDMTIRVWNDHIKNAKAMGHWWINIEVNGSIEVNGEVQTSTSDVHRLVRVDHRDGTIEHSMTLTQMFDSIASTDGVSFYANNGDKLYKINVTNETETLVGTLPSSGIKTLEFVGTTLMAFDSTSDKLIPINKDTGGAIVGGVTLGGITDLDSINFFPLKEDPKFKLTSYD